MSTTHSYIVPSDVKINDQIKFRVTSIEDSNIYSGKVIGIVNYAAARVYNGDIASSHTLMLEGMSQKYNIDIETIPYIKDETFIVVSCSDGLCRPFAYSWLCKPTGEHGYVEIIEEGKTYSIRVMDASADSIAAAISLLRNNGYVCHIISE